MNTLKYILFGDSITEYGNWNYLLNGINITNKGISGDTTKDLLRRFDRSIDKDADIVFIMVGINDIIQKVNVEKVFCNYIEILEKLQRLEIKPIVQSTLYVGEQLDKLDPIVNKNVTQLNTKLEKYCNENNIRYLNINSLLAPNNILENQYTDDSVHINIHAYIKWGQYLNTIIKDNN